MAKKKGNTKKAIRKRIGRKTAGLGAGAMLILAGIGAGFATGRLSTNLGVDLKGFESIIPVGASFSVGGPIAAIATLILDRLPSFFGEQQMGGAGEAI